MQFETTVEEEGMEQKPDIAPFYGCRRGGEEKRHFDIIPLWCRKVPVESLIKSTYVPYSILPV